MSLSSEQRATGRLLIPKPSAEHQEGGKTGPRMGGPHWTISQMGQSRPRGVEQLPQATRLGTLVECGLAPEPVSLSLPCGHLKASWLQMVTLHLLVMWAGQVTTQSLHSLLRRVIPPTLSARVLSHITLSMKPSGLAGFRLLFNPGGSGGWRMV